ncbi:MAG: transcriptional regulator, partial [Eubacteriales bacterium]|nr:transcriptional regulator [Eubacteriales bacterium]
LLQNVDRLGDFQKSMLFRHMKFKEADASYYQEIKERLLEGFRDDESFGYMRGHKGWTELMR